MIYDRFENLNLYAVPGSLLHRALVYARDVAADVADGRIEIDGERLYASVASYETGGRDERRFEAHRRYIDIQVLLAGEETIDVALDRRLARPRGLRRCARRDVPQAPGARRLAADAARMVRRFLPARPPPPRVPFEGQAEGAQDRHESGRPVNGRRLL